MRALFSCMPWEGHFRPLLPLAHALQARGHEVAFASAAAWEPAVSGEGFALLPAGLSHADGRARTAPLWSEVEALPPEARRPKAFATIFARVHAPAKLPELVEVARSWPAEVIVFDSCDLAAPIAAAALGVLSANHSFGAMIPAAALAAATPYLEPLWREHGLEPDPSAGAFRGLYVDLAPPTFAWEQPRGRVVPLRPVTEELGEPPEWLDELEQPFVYVTLGTVHGRPELFRPLLDGLDGKRAVVTIGRSSSPADLEPVPDSVRVEQFVPQAHVLRRCAAVISHGGSGTTLGALAYGLPLLLAPQAADQFENAARAEAAGAAIVLRPGEVTRDAVSGALRRILEEPSFRESAAAVAAEIAAMPTAQEVVAAVEEFVARG